MVLSAALTIAPEDADYGDVVVGATSESTTFTVRNSGNAPTEGLQTSFVGANANAFAITRDGCAGVALLPDESCEIDVAFAPLEGGQVSAFLAVDPGDAATAQAELIGVGIVGTMQITPMVHVFDAIADGATSTAQQFEVENVGDSASGVLTTETTGADAMAFEIVANDCAGIDLVVGATCNVSVVFHAMGAAERRATLEVRSASGFGAATLRGLSLGALAANCTSNDHCQSSVCADGVCCDRACRGCEQCDLSGTEGTCTALLAGPALGRCDAPCAQDRCDGSGGCVPAPLGTPCGLDGPCANVGSRDRQWIEASSGAMICTGVSTECTSRARCASALACDGATNECRETCRNDNDCVLGTFCNGTNCVAASASGTCSRHAECADDSFGGWGAMLCVGGTCQQCNTDEDCAGGRIPALFPSRCNAGTCGSATCTNSSQCSGLGWGPLCRPTAMGSPTSICGGCTTDVDCDYAAAPFCLASGGTRKCGCDLATAGVCRTGTTCVGTGAAAACRTIRDFTCLDSSECASGSCVDQRCE
jgi:hypothetical protein